MIPCKVNRGRLLAILALLLACAPANNSTQAAESSTTVRSDTATIVPASAAPKDSDGVKADLARIQGSSSAPVWVIEVSDFQCPFCKQWHDETYQKLRDEFVKTGKIRLAYINFPLNQHVNAWPAAEAAMCAGAQGKFWEMHDALFINQKKWEQLTAPAPFFDSLARATGLNVPQWQQCLKSGKMKPWIQADYDRAQAAGAASTPTFIIGDKMLTGAQPIENFRSAIDSAAAKAKKTTP
ncbi:MAG TPA: thioredoxin domain-containing protein [Gemmatimonadaceae bacterium]|nr:thioredoxin domain-containing protein [Gemmatimonadaceae bacterium]